MVQSGTAKHENGAFSETHTSFGTRMMVGNASLLPTLHAPTIGRLSCLVWPALSYKPTRYSEPNHESPGRRIVQAITRTMIMLDDCSQNNGIFSPHYLRHRERCDKSVSSIAIYKASLAPAHRFHVINYVFYVNPKEASYKAGKRGSAGSIEERSSAIRCVTQNIS